ncbi:FkbM family methyltransferase, partial [Candidatus Sumerlaeota bacterium]|nr:FkbM family methyltransferase [Candidatus Sumerlaeota bacterium]
RAVVNGADEFWFVNRHFHVITWEPEEYAALDHLVRPGMTVMDIGAHDGLYTLALAKRVGPSGHVVSFEPSPDTFEVLKANCRNNGFAGRVTAENCLVGDMEGEVDFHWIPGDTSPLNSAASGVAHLEGTNARTIRRPMVTLDAYCKSRGIKPDLIKVDIEGFELNLLKGGRFLILFRTLFHGFRHPHTGALRILDVDPALRSPPARSTPGSILSPPAEG